MPAVPTIILALLVVPVLAVVIFLVLRNRSQARARHEQALAALPPQERQRHHDIKAARTGLTRAEKTRERELKAARREVEQLSAGRTVGRAGQAVLTPTTFSPDGGRSTRELSRRTRAEVTRPERVRDVVPPEARYAPCHLDGQQVGGVDDLARRCAQEHTRNETVRFLVVADPAWVDAVTVRDGDQTPIDLAIRVTTTANRVDEHRARTERARGRLTGLERDTGKVDEARARLEALGPDPLGSGHVPGRDEEEGRRT